MNSMTSYNGGRLVVWGGDCLALMAAMAPESVDAIVTDPPYGLGFMGKKWDDLPPGKEWAEACYRVLKPGGHLLAFGGTRTWHRLAVAVEDGGFEIRDSLAWLYGSGFPKSMDVSKAIDKAAGAEREVIGSQLDRWTGKGGVLNFATDRPQSEIPVTGGAATPEAGQWQGWGTALKPAFEPIVVARKPLVGAVAANVLKHGTGALNIDGCRLPTDEVLHTSTVPNDMRGGHYGSGHRPGEPSGQRRYTEQGGTNFAATPGPRGGSPSGRWPANVILDESQAAELDRQAPKTGAAAKASGPTLRGGASRFFYCAKAPKSERPVIELADGSKLAHPTVKPLAVMRWLVRLVTPPDGLVLDTFAGTGTTGEACILEGFRCLLAEDPTKGEADYLPLIDQRITRVLASLPTEKQETVA